MIKNDTCNRYILLIKSSWEISSATCVYHMVYLLIIKHEKRLFIMYIVGAVNYFKNNMQHFIQLNLSGMYYDDGINFVCDN